MKPCILTTALLALLLPAFPVALQAQEAGGAEDTGSSSYGERLDEALTGGSDDTEPADEATSDEPAADDAATTAPDAGDTEPAVSGSEASAPVKPASTETAAPAPAVPPGDETPEQKGLRLAEEAKAANEGFKWQTAAGRMILRDAQGNTNERAFTSEILEDQDKSDQEGVRGIIVFQHPPDIKNTALLTIGQLHEDDYQWLYLPALKRVKRISGTGKTGSFVGSEFSYEDLSAAAIEDYDYVWLAEEPCPGAETLTCNQVERRPKDNDSGYSRIVTWEEVGTFRTFKSDFYDRKGALLKTLVIARDEKFKDRWWRAMDMTMTNHINGKSTQMLWSAYDFDTPLSEGDFTVRALERLQ